MITQQPQSQTVVAGNPLTLSVAATGSPPLFYRWRKDGVPITSATNSVLTIPQTTTNDAGIYTVLVSNSVLPNGVFSSNANVTIGQPCPFVICPTSISTNCNGPGGTVVAFEAFGGNPCNPGDFEIVCTPPSGSVFPPGVTTVHCLGRAPRGGLQTGCDFTVTVTGACPPCLVLNCPTNVVVPCEGTNGTLVSYTVTATNYCGAHEVGVICLPPSGSLFPPGVTTVNCIASSSNETWQCSFTVTALSNCPPSMCSSNLLVNGSFEEPTIPDFYWQTGGDDPLITGWTTMPNGVEYHVSLPVNTAYPVVSGFAAEGRYAVDLASANGPGGIRQSIATRPGYEYEVSFAMGTSLERGRVGTASLMASVDGLPRFFETMTTSPQVVWERKRFKFVATTSSTTLAFATTDDPALHFVELDDVQACELGRFSTMPAVSFAQHRSGIALRLDRRFYSPGDGIQAELDLGDHNYRYDQVLVFLATPSTGDFEYLTLARTAPHRFASTTPTPLGAISEAAVRNDRRLQAAAGESVVASWYVMGLEAGGTAVEENVVADIAFVTATTGLPTSQVSTSFALTADELSPSPGAKRVGTLLMTNELPVQVALDELIFAPTDEAQLARFLAEVGGRVVLTDALAEEAASGRRPRTYLVRVDLARAPLDLLPQMRAINGDSGTLLASSEDTLRLLALASYCQLLGYRVGVNPRLLPQGAPTFTELTPPDDAFKPYTHPLLDLPWVWSFMALWEADIKSVKVAFLDEGFSVNSDFRVPAGGLVECNLENASIIEAAFGVDLSVINCGAGVAETPPTVGASFFGEKVWHGNGVVTVAAGVLNNGGGVGTGGQVVEPMLYRMGPVSYAFEMGLGIQHAVINNAQVINISASYPCKLLDRLGANFEICTQRDRLGFCAALPITLGIIFGSTCVHGLDGCDVPIFCDIADALVGAVCGAVGVIAGVLLQPACLLTVLPEDPRGPLNHALEVATNAGVAVVTVAGNRINPDNLQVGVRDIINLSNRRVEDWMIIPATLPGVIVASDCSNDFPFENQDFFGNAVDVWVPEGEPFMAPPTEASAPPSAHERMPFTGSSAAAPYVAGLIANLQALNLNLNPRTAPPEQLRFLPARLKQLLRDTAWSAGQLADAAPTPALRAETMSAASERRNLINPSNLVWTATVLPLSDGSPPPIPNYPALGYDTRLNFDEVDDVTSADTRGHARTLPGGVWRTGTTLAIPREGGATMLADRDWFRYDLPPTLSAGLWQALFELRVPRRSGFPTIGDRAYSVDLLGNEGFESVYQLRSPEFFPGASAQFALNCALANDTVYRLAIVSFAPTRDVPPADRFDRNDPAVNPPESRPNNDEKTRAVHLGEAGGEFAWVYLGEHREQETWEIRIPGLNFHRLDDHDWFRLIPPPIVDGCLFDLSVTTEHPDPEDESAPAAIRVEAADGMPFVSEDGSRFVTGVYGFHLTEWSPSSDPVFLRLYGGESGRFSAYTLVIRFASVPERMCLLMEAGMAGSAITGTSDDPCPTCHFPAFRPDLIQFGPGEYGSRFGREGDPAGRVITPDLYFIRWTGAGIFRAAFVLEQGPSLRVRLLDFNNRTLALAQTLDLAGDGALPGLLAAGAPPVAPLGPDVPQTLWLTATNLPAGEYAIAVSHGRTNTLFGLFLPLGAVANPQTSLEAVLARGQKSPLVLRAESDGKHLDLSWESSAVRYLLESRRSLKASDVWVPVPVPPNMTNELDAVRLPLNGREEYFRLRLDY